MDDEMRDYLWTTLGVTPFLAWLFMALAVLIVARGWDWLRIPDYDRIAQLERELGMERERE